MGSRSPVIRNNLRKRIEERCLANGVDQIPTLKQLSAETHIAIPVLSAWMNNDVRRFDDKIILRLMDYLEITDVGQLLEINRSV
jgi:hypothetical protein